ncbi:hypothetical protein B484DRAFT_422963 [Ochromonadaceae sp. CCMP2298]|nr:hypothetical protein B484DRAFT_422963 [Ochromonadaceae sp. CCMP2298]
MKLSVGTTCISVIALVVMLGQVAFLCVLKNPWHDPSERVPSGGSTLGEAHTSVAKSYAEQPPSLLFMLASYSFDQFRSVQRVLDCMRDICNAGWDVTVHMQVSPDSLSYAHPMFAVLRERAFCLRTGAPVPIVLEQFERIGFGLNSKHRAYAAAHVEEFDYFAYAEEDMLLSLSHLQAFIAAQARLREALPRHWLRYQVGFLRYEESLHDFHRVTWEYFPHQVHVVDMGLQQPSLGKYIFTNNLNQAIYIFPREQLLDLEQRCEFLTRPGRNAFYQELRRAQNKDWRYMSVGVSEWSSSFQQVLQCGLRRIIPAEHFQLYMIHHSTDKAQKRRLRKELLTVHNWTQLVANKSLPAHCISIEQAQYGVLPQQYSLELMDLDSLRGKAKWDWDL